MLALPLAALPVLREALRLDPLEFRTPYLNVLGIARVTRYFSSLLLQWVNSAGRMSHVGLRVERVQYL